MNHIYINSQYALLDLAQTIMKRGNEVVVRGNRTKEMLAKTINLVNPNERCIFILNRNDNIFAKIAETLWMLRGRDDIDWLSFYLPRARDFSDDGIVWRGAYGPRLRNWQGEDQIRNVVDLLRADTTSRQAVISLWDPCTDLKPTKDVPCNNWIQFIIREGCLEMFVTQRSSDLIWGYSGIDAFAWSVLHQMMAKWLDVRIDTFTHFIGSLHIYERHWKSIGEWMTTPDKFLDPYRHGLLSPRFTVDISELDRYLDLIFSIEQSTAESIKKGEYTAKVFLKFSDYVMDPFLKTCLQMLMLYRYMKHVGSINDAVLEMLEIIGEYDFRLAAIEYISRKHKEELRKVLRMSYVESLFMLRADKGINE